MTDLSVVIITKNEAHNIERCIQSCLPLQCKILVLDSASMDDTVAIAERLGAQVHTVEWKGYGATKNEGAALATSNWILSLDADEALNKGQIESIQESFKRKDNVIAYWLKRTLILNGKELSYGAVWGEHRLRLYRKDKMQWSLDEVHEDLQPIDRTIEWAYGELQGSLLHYSYKDLADMRGRLEHYAKLSAQKLQGKRKTYLMLKRLFAPAFSFIKNYFFRAGILDGKEGFVFAREQARYVRKKYSYALLRG